MNTISRQNNLAWILRPCRAQNDVLVGLLLVFTLLFCACDFHGPWDYYPEEREVYTGIYTYGYILGDGETRVCFSKVYELDETASKDFAFYDSAHVTVQGKFRNESGSEIDTVIEIGSEEPEMPNCFSRPQAVGVYNGIVGETYTMEAFFKWDSAGHTVKSTYSAQATIPAPVKVKGLSVPKQDGSFEQVDYSEGDTIHVEFLEFPLDMETVKCALDYEKSIKGVISILQYGMGNTEAQNTTINMMLAGLTEEDSTGYRGVAMHDPLEREMNLGYTTKQNIGGYNALDTLFLPNLMMPLGPVTVVFYSTDESYIDYESKVKGSVSDSRVLPESNIENGMGVFSGMSKSTFPFYVEGDGGVSMEHIAFRNCDETSGDNSDSWDSRGCRLYQDVYCSGMTPVEMDAHGYDLMEANMNAHYYYEHEVYRSEKTCYPSLVKAAMMNKKEKWSVYLPDTISDEDKSAAYADGLKRYCVARDFENNSIADCSKLREECLESPEKNGCKEYLWNWCADRSWPNRYRIDDNTCNIALISRYYLEGQNSPILKREVESLCNYYKYPICKKF